MGSEFGDRKQYAEGRRQEKLTLTTDTDTKIQFRVMSLPACRTGREFGAKAGK